jgi:hypothetical protein
MSLLNSAQAHRMSPFRPLPAFLLSNHATVNAVPCLASGLQVLGTLTALTALSGILSFTFSTFLRPGVSVRDDNTSFTFPPLVHLNN